MNGGRSKVNISLGPTAAEMRRTSEGLVRLRAAVQSKDYWIIASDDERTAHACYALVGLLLSNGLAAPDQVAMADLDVALPDQRHPLPLSIAAISKSALSPEHVVYLLARLTRCSHADRLELLGFIRAGRDLFPLGSDPELITLALDGLAAGRVSVLDPKNN